MSYDKNGNIMSLQRNGEFDDSIVTMEIDNLVYDYDINNPNLLLKVTDSTNNPNGFKDGTNTNDDYDYDDNGNLKIDQNKGITNINYNHLNLPTKIEFGTNANIEYIYNAIGTKLQKKVREGNTVIITEYISGFQYQKKGDAPVVLEFFPHAEGYVKNTVVNNINNYNYVFNYTDHLGNIRVSYGLDANNVLKILEENNYYPYGLKHNNYNMSEHVYKKTMQGNVNLVACSSCPQGYQNKYNGKSWETDLGLNIYAMDARQYDPAIGRWMVQDPVIHHNMSPYNAFDNNPVFWADPSGADSQKYDSNGFYIPPYARTDDGHYGNIGGMSELINLGMPTGLILKFHGDSQMVLQRILDEGLGKGVAKIVDGRIVINGSRDDLATDKQKGLFDVISRVVNSEQYTEINVYNKAKDIFGGAYKHKKIDIGDINAFGTGELMNKFTVLGHELNEQWEYQEGNKKLYKVPGSSHMNSCELESTMNGGWKREETRTENLRRYEIFVPSYTSPGKVKRWSASAIMHTTFTRGNEKRVFTYVVIDNEVQPLK
jgi:RHS repeat-associated protein